MSNSATNRYQQELSSAEKRALSFFKRTRGVSDLSQVTEEALHVFPALSPKDAVVCLYEQNLRSSHTRLKETRVADSEEGTTVMNMMALQR